MIIFTRDQIRFFAQASLALAFFSSDFAKAGGAQIPHPPVTQNGQGTNGQGVKVIDGWPGMPNMADADQTVVIQFNPEDISNVSAFTTGDHFTSKTPGVSIDVGKTHFFFGGVLDQDANMFTKQTQDLIESAIRFHRKIAICPKCRPFENSIKIADAEYAPKSQTPTADQLANQAKEDVESKTRDYIHEQLQYAIDVKCGDVPALALNPPDLPEAEKQKADLEIAQAEKNLGLTGPVGNVQPVLNSLKKLYGIGPQGILPSPPNSLDQRLSQDQKSIDKMVERFSHNITLSADEYYDKIPTLDEVKEFENLGTQISTSLENDLKGKLRTEKETIRKNYAPLQKKYMLMLASLLNGTRITSDLTNGANFGAIHNSRMERLREDISKVVAENPDAVLGEFTKTPRSVDWMKAMKAMMDDRWVDPKAPFAKEVDEHIAKNLSLAALEEVGVFSRVNNLRPAENQDVNNARNRAEDNLFSEVGRKIGLLTFCSDDTRRQLKYSQAELEAAHQAQIKSLVGVAFGGLAANLVSRLDVNEEFFAGDLASDGANFIVSHLSAGVIDAATESFKKADYTPAQIQAAQAKALSIAAADTDQNEGGVGSLIYSLSFNQKFKGVQDVSSTPLMQEHMKNESSDFQNLIKDNVKDPSGAGGDIYWQGR